MSQQYINNAIFWVELEKIKPNPFQPRREFDPLKLQELADSIRMYGVLQPLVVTRKEITRDDGGLFVEYELISGERRLRGSRLAGISQVPVIIRAGEGSDREKLELSIIENLQREDLNPVDRARAFQRLAEEFGFKHADIGKKVGKSREYVSNTMRILDLPLLMLQALSEGKIAEGHTRPLLMLSDRPQEQALLLKEIVYKKITVRDAEGTARRIAVERARKRVRIDPELRAFEEKLCESLGTRVTIERTEAGGKIHIDFFSSADLRALLDRIDSREHASLLRPMGQISAAEGGGGGRSGSVPAHSSAAKDSPERAAAAHAGETPVQTDARSIEASEEPNEEIYAVKNFSI
ncbi:MAG: ParB-like protein partition protein [Parcubacteria group bacterium Greene0416_79]|nr:MAG: ParB-like protein partition protein [Parcubacteria group bacterium Greene0416_79]